MLESYKTDRNNKLNKKSKTNKTEKYDIDENNASRNCNVNTYIKGLKCLKLTTNYFVITYSNNNVI